MVVQFGPPWGVMLLLLNTMLVRKIKAPGIQFPNFLKIMIVTIITKRCPEVLFGPPFHMRWGPG